MPDKVITKIWGCLIFCIGSRVLVSRPRHGIHAFFADHSLPLVAEAHEEQSSAKPQPKSLVSHKGTKITEKGKKNRKTGGRK